MTDGRVEVMIMLSQLLDVAVAEARAELGNKLGLSCAKLRASLIFLALMRSLFTLMD